MPVAFARSCEIKIDALDHGWGSMVDRRARCQENKKSDDQRAPVTRYYLIKEPGH